MFGICEVWQLAPQVLIGFQGRRPDRHIKMVKVCMGGYKCSSMLMDGWVVVVVPTEDSV